MITVTERAAEQIKAVLQSQAWQGYGLRFGLQDGGCSGYTYLLDFEPTPDEDDLVHEEHGVQVFIHPLHLPFIAGATITWREATFEEGFHIENPNVKRLCGCGDSFDV